MLEKPSHPVATADYLRVCEQAARAGGDVLRSWRGRFAVAAKGPRDLVTEADLASQREIREIVLSAFPEHDFEGEETLDAVLPQSDDPCQRDVDASRLRWIVDPLDGTTNYVHGFPAYCVSVALAAGDVILVGAIVDPVSGECFTARAGHGAWLDGSPITVSRTTEPATSLVAVSFPAHASAACQAVADFLAILPEVRSIRRSGSSALNLAYVACGRLDGFWARRIASWDVAAGLLLVQEAGGATAPLALPDQGQRCPGELIPLSNPAFIACGTEILLTSLRDCLNGASRST